jgi:hypothetical protein
MRATTLSGIEVKGFYWSDVSLTSNQGYDSIQFTRVVRNWSTGRVTMQHTYGRLICGYPSHNWLMLTANFSCQMKNNKLSK